MLEKAGDCKEIGELALNDDEKELISILAKFPQRVRAARLDYEPSTVTRYILELCQCFNRFYHNCPILKADEATKSVRVMLCRVTKNVLGNALWLIGLERPEKI